MANGEIIIRINAVGPSRQPVDLHLCFQTPVEDGAVTPSYTCAYRFDPIGWSSHATAGNPLQAIRLAMFKARVELVHRFKDWRLFYPDGTAMELDYDEGA